MKEERHLFLIVIWMSRHFKCFNILEKWVINCLQWLSEQKFWFKPKVEQDFKSSSTMSPSSSNSEDSHYVVGSTGHQEESNTDLERWTRLTKFSTFRVRTEWENVKNYSKVQTGGGAHGAVRLQGGGSGGVQVLPDWGGDQHLLHPQLLPGSELFWVLQSGYVVLQERC